MSLFKNPNIKKVGSYFMELLIVVVGVSIAFQLSVWKDTRKEKVREEYLLQNFISENLLNQAEIDTSIVDLEDVLKANPELIKLLLSPQPEMDSIKEKLATLYVLSWPDLSTAHLDNYLEFAAGNSQLNEEMLVLKSSYVGANELIRVYIDRKQEYYFDFLADVVDINDGLKVANKEKLFSVHLRNNLTVLYFYETVLLDTYSKISASQKKVMEIIEAGIDQ